MLTAVGSFPTADQPPRRRCSHFKRSALWLRCATYAPSQPALVHRHLVMITERASLCTAQRQLASSLTAWLDASCHGTSEQLMSARAGPTHTLPAVTAQVVAAVPRGQRPPERAVTVSSIGRPFRSWLSMLRPAPSRVLRFETGPWAACSVAEPLAAKRWTSTALAALLSVIGAEGAAFDR